MADKVEFNYFIFYFWITNEFTSYDGNYRGCVSSKRFRQSHRPYGKSAGYLVNPFFTHRRIKLTYILSP